jgi:hypothetical protein
VIAVARRENDGSRAVREGSSFGKQFDALHKATRSIPVVLMLSNDPVGPDYIAGMAKPGGTITGFTVMQPGEPAAIICRIIFAQRVLWAQARLHECKFHYFTNPGGCQR